VAGHLHTILDVRTEHHIEATDAEIRQAMREIMQYARYRHVPINIVAWTGEEAANLRQLLSSGHVTNRPSSPRRQRREAEEMAPEDVPSAWDRLLVDETETPTCPKNEAPPKPQRLTPPAKPKRLRKG
jgi:hypothetical protein